MRKLIKQPGSPGAVECNMLIKLPIIFPRKSIKNVAEACSISFKCIGFQFSIVICRIPQVIGGGKKQ